MEDVGRALGAGDAEVADRHVGQRERVAREPCDGSRGEHPHRGVERAAPRLRHDLHRERQQREQADGREQRPGAEREARPRLSPADGEPGERDDAVDECGGLRDVREREDGCGEGDRETQPRSAERGGPGGERPTDVLDALGTVLSGSPGLATTALALAIVAVLLPRAAARGPWGIAGLGALQLVLVLVWAPAIAATGVVVGTWLLCGILAARPYLAVAVRPLLVAATQRARNES